MLEVLLAFAGSFCAGILFNITKRNLLWTGLAGMAGWIAFALMYEASGEIIVSTFMGAVAVGLYSESMARFLKSPATVFSISGIFPLVPGIAAYNTIQFIVEGKLPEAADKAVETVASAGAIAFGIMLVTAVFRFISKFREKGLTTDYTFRNDYSPLWRFYYFYLDTNISLRNNLIICCFS